MTDGCDTGVVAKALSKASKARHQRPNLAAPIAPVS